MTDIPQWLSRAGNHLRYMELIDNPDTEAYKIRELVIFPTLFALMQETLGDKNIPLVDFGSGTGSLSARLAEVLNVSVEGIDASVNFVRLARQKHPEQPFYVAHGRPPVGYHLNNTHAHLVLHCTPHPEQLLEDMADTTEPNGYVFITIPHPDYFKASGQLTGPQKVLIGEQAQMTYYRRSIQEYETLFAQAGLSIVKKSDCYAPNGASRLVDKYKKHPYFIVYVLQKQLDIVDTAMVTHSGSGKILLLTRALHDDKFPGIKSFFSTRRLRDSQQGSESLARSMQARLDVVPDYVSPYALGSLMVKHRHKTKTQHARVNLYAVKITGDMPKFSNQFYAKSQFINPGDLRPFGGACTQLGYEFLRSHVS